MEHASVKVVVWNRKNKLLNEQTLIIFQNTWTYEELPILKFEPTPKSSYLTIIQHNPIFAIIYILCGLVLLMCAIYRLSKRIQGKEKG